MSWELMVKKKTTTNSLTFIKSVGSGLKKSNGNLSPFLSFWSWVKIGMTIRGKFYKNTKSFKNVHNFGTSLAVQWLRLRASTVGCTGSSIPGRGTKIRMPRGVAEKKKKMCVNL